MKLNIDGQVKIEGRGNGPVDAVFNCIKLLVPHDQAGALSGHAVTEGTDAQAEVSVRLAHEGRHDRAWLRSGYRWCLGQAYLGALNRSS